MSSPSRQIDNTSSLAQVFLLLLVLVSAFALYEAYTVDQLRYENAKLNSEKLLWQSATMTVMRARGWVMSTTKPEHLTPENLRYGLNPCYTTRSGNYVDYNRDCVAASMSSSPVGVPIRIELAESWP